MELYLEDLDMIRGPLHWDAPEGLADPSPPPGGGGRRRAVTRPRTGTLLTIARSTPEQIEGVEHVCDTPEQVVEVIGSYTSITMLFINCHSTDAAGVTDAGSRGSVAGILLGGARILASHLPLFSGVRSSFAPHSTDPMVARLVLEGHSYQPGGGAAARAGPVDLGLRPTCGTDPDSCPYDIDLPLRDEVPAAAPTPPPPPRDLRLTAEGFNDQHIHFEPRIVMRSCSIGQCLPFCQGLADATGAYVFAPTVDQWARQTRDHPWTLHGPVRLFVPAAHAGILQASLGGGDASPFRQRRGGQARATGWGRGTGRLPGTAGIA